MSSVCVSTLIWSICHEDHTEHSHIGNLYTFKKNMTPGHSLLFPDSAASNMVVSLQFFADEQHHTQHLVSQCSGTKHAHWETSLLHSSGLLEQTHRRPFIPFISIHSLYGVYGAKPIAVGCLSLHWFLCSFIRST